MTSLTRGFKRVLGKYRMESVLDLWSAILRDRLFLKDFIDDLTVNLTELFRNPEFWLEIGKILPEYSRNKTLRIWHAGCSTGEEVYTMAMLLHETGMLMNTELLGTDLSSRVLEKAKLGDYFQNKAKYCKSLLEVLPNVDITKYFTEDENTFTVKRSLRANVTFRKQDLTKQAPIGTFDIILCRNVMIYFDDSLKLKVIESFYNSLPEGGLFILGFYDMMPSGHEKYFTVLHPSSRIYVRQS